MKQLSNLIFLAYGSETPSWSLSESYEILYKSILMLGTNVRTDSLNKKISFLTILFAGIILYWLWEAQLISYFSFPSKKLPFNNLAEFLEKSDNKVSFEETVTFHKGIQMSNVTL